MERFLKKNGFTKSEDADNLYTYRVQKGDFYIDIGVTTGDYDDYEEDDTLENERLWHFVIFRWGQWRKFDPENFIILIELVDNDEIEIGINPETGKRYNKKSYNYHTILRRLNKTRYAVNTITKQGRDYLSVPDSGAILFYVISNHTFYTRRMLEATTSGNPPCFPVRKYTKQNVLSHKDRLEDQRTYGLVEKERSIACNANDMFNETFYRDKLENILKNKDKFLIPFGSEFSGVMDEFRTYLKEGKLVNMNKVELDMWEDNTDYLQDTLRSYKNSSFF